VPKLCTRLLLDMMNRMLRTQPHRL